MLIAPAYLSDIAAVGLLALLCDQIGSLSNTGLAARRDAMAGDRRCVQRSP